MKLFIRAPKFLGATLIAVGFVNFFAFLIGTVILGRSAGRKIAGRYYVNNHGREH